MELVRRPLSISRCHNRSLLGIGAEDGIAFGLLLGVAGCLSYSDGAYNPSQDRKTGSFPANLTGPRARSIIEPMSSGWKVSVA